jgi:hypothetical protein
LARPWLPSGPASLFSLSEVGHVFQSQGRPAIRIWPKGEIDELVLCLPEKKDVYVHLAARGRLATGGNLGIWDLPS